MKASAFAAAVLFLAGAPCAARADYDPALWRYLRPLQGEAAGLVEVELDEAAYAHARLELEDVRVIDQDGAEVARALRRYSAGETVDAVPAALLNVGTEGREVVFELDVGAREGLPAERRIHNRIDLDFGREGGPRGTFLKRVEVAASADGKAFRVLSAEGLVFDYELGGRRVAGGEVRYPDSDLQFLRVRLFGGEGEVPPLVGATVQRKQPRFGRERTRELPAPARSLSAWPCQGRASSRGESFYDFDLGSAQAPSDEIVLRFEGGSFVRSVDVWVSDDKETCRPIAHGELSRVTLVEQIVERGMVSLHRARGRYLRLAVDDGDDQAIAIAGATVRWSPDFVIFEARPSRRFQLAYGNPKARAPRYDLDARLRVESPAIGKGPELGPEAENPAFRPPTPPVTERLPWLPNLAVALGGLALLAVLYRAARRSGRGQDSASPDR